MASKMFAEVVIAGSYKNLAKSTRGASKELSNFEKGAKKISGAVKAAFAGIALLGIGAMSDAIVDLTKAAEGDAKTTNKLNKSLDNTWKATDKTKKSVADYIDKMSNLTGIVDDNLRPAYATLARQTKSQEKANKMLNLSMDVAADKNISVEKAAKLVAKAMSGNQKAFDRLYPSASKSGDALKYVSEQAKGMAMAGTGPIDRINNVIENFKEKLGAAFLPIAENIADWLAGPEAQKTLDEMAQKVQDAFAWLSSPEGKAAIQEWYEKAKKLVDQVVRMVDGLAKFLDMMPGGNTLAERDKKTSNDVVSKAAKSIAEALRTSERTSLVQQTNLGNTTGSARRGVDGSQMAATTVNIYGVASGTDVVNALQRYAKGKGIPMSKLLR